MHATCKILLLLLHEHAYIAMQCILRDLNDVWLQCFCCSRYTPHVQLKEFLMGIDSWQQPLHPRVIQIEMCSSCSQVVNGVFVSDFAALKIVTCKAFQDTRDA